MRLPPHVPHGSANAHPASGLSDFAASAVTRTPLAKSSLPQGNGPYSCSVRPVMVTRVRNRRLMASPTPASASSTAARRSSDWASPGDALGMRRRARLTCQAGPSLSRSQEPVAKGPQTSRIARSAFSESAARIVGGHQLMRTTVAVHSTKRRRTLELSCEAPRLTRLRQLQLLVRRRRISRDFGRGIRTRARSAFSSAGRRSSGISAIAHLTAGTIKR
jgi:hypothetical protein